MSSGTVRAAGTVLWRPVNDGGDGVEIAVVHRPKLNDWSLPKGKLEHGETPAAAATRETWEETGSRAVLGRPLGQVGYPVFRPRPGRKVVTYFAARPVSDWPAQPSRADESPFTVNHEVDDLRWLRPSEAAGLLDYDTDRTVLERFTAVPADAHTVLLVRHAKAGHRSGWTGPDEQRPLSAAGADQADALRAMLPLFGPARVYAADRTRCVQTVQGLAGDLGVPVAVESVFVEEAFHRDPDAAVERLSHIARRPGVPVICSQGGTIPGLIRRIAARSALPLGDVLPCKKGSTWVLSFAGTALVAADYIATALPTPCP